MIFQPQIVGKPLPTLTNPGTAADLLSGKQLIDANGNVLTGTMVNRGAQSKVLEQGDSYTIPAGYHNGNGVISAKKPISFTQTYDRNDITEFENFAITIPSQYTIISRNSKECGLSFMFRGRGKYGSYSETDVAAGFLPVVVSYNRMEGYIAISRSYGGFSGSIYYEVNISNNTIEFEHYSPSNDFVITFINYLKIYLLVFEN